MKLLLLLLLIIIIFILIKVARVVYPFFKMWRNFNNLRKQQDDFQNRNTKNGQQAYRKQTSKKQNKSGHKIISQDEGEYIDFIDIKDKK